MFVDRGAPRLAVACLTLLLAFESNAQERATQLSAQSEQQLSAALAIDTADRFVEAVRPLTELARVDLTTAAEKAMRLRVAEAAKSLLLDKAKLAEASGDTLWALSWWSQGLLSEAERAEVDASLAALGGSRTVNELAEQLRVRELLAGGGYNAVEQRRAAMATRAREVGVENLSDIELLHAFHYLAPSSHATDGFHVEWRGLITAPRDGEYVFSASPLDISTEYPGAYHRQTAALTLAGQEIILATPDDWRFQSQPVALRAGNPVPFAMTLDYEYEDDHTRVAAGVLRWKAAGISSQIVPASALTLPSGEAGIEMTARWSCQFPGDEQATRVMEETNIVPQVDKCFFSRVVCPDRDLVMAVTREKVRRLVTPEAIKNLYSPATPESPAVQHYHPLLRGGSQPHTRLIESCSSSDRLLCLNAMLESPQVIRGAPLGGLIDAYNLLRVGAERESLDLLGVWMQAHADTTSQLAGDAEEFFSKNRWDYRRLTIALVWEHPESFDWLKDDYLETEEGGCCLPVAYTVAYGSLVQGKIDQWIMELDNRLSDESLSGDKRVNWLIARAMAEEIRSRAGSRHQRTPERLTAGMGWLQEAMLVADTEATRNRVAREQVARYAASHRWHLAGENTGSDGLREELAGVRAGFDHRLAADKVKSLDALQEELRRRQSLAEQRSAPAAAKRYGEAIATLEDSKTEAD